MFHTKIARGAEGEGGDGGVGTKKAFVVAVIGDAVCAVGVVVYKTEVVGGASENLCQLTEVIQALRNGSWFACLVAVWRYDFRG